MKGDDLGEGFGVEEPALRGARVQADAPDEEEHQVRDTGFSAEDPAFYLKPDGEE